MAPQVFGYLWYILSQYFLVSPESSGIKSSENFLIELAPISILLVGLHFGAIILARFRIVLEVLEGLDLVSALNVERLALSAYCNSSSSCFVYRLVTRAGA